MILLGKRQRNCFKFFISVWESTLNVKLSNFQLTKLKSGTKNGSEVTLKLSSIVVGDSNDETTFPHKLFLTNAPVLRF